MALKKYRPYLSEHAIRWIYTEAGKQRADSEEAALTFLEIASFAINLDASKLKSSYTIKPREDLMSALGGASKIDKDTLTNPSTLKLITYNKYISTPSDCTEEETLIAIEYKEIVIKESLTPEEQAIVDKSWGM